MAKQQGLSLFDMIEKEEVLEEKKDCSHRVERRTLTVFPGETSERITMTCEICGRIRGWCYERVKHGNTTA